MSFTSSAHGFPGVRVVIFALLFATVATLAQDAEPRTFDPNYDDPDVSALNRLIAPREGEEPAATFARYKSELSEPLLFSKILAVLRKHSNQHLDERSAYREPVLSAMRVLSASGRDESVDAIAPYLKHPLPQVREHAAENLRVTQSPRAVPPLKAALLESESQMPPALTPEPATEASISTLTTYFRALSMIRSDDALAALDASLNRLRGRYGASEVGGELLRQLQHIRETGGIQEYRREAAVRSPIPNQEAPPPPTLVPSTSIAAATPVVSPPATPIAQTPAIPAERRSPAWPWVVGGIAALLVVVTLVLKRGC